MHKITPHLWFDGQAEEAARFYCSIFKNSKVGEITHYNETVAEFAHKPAGSVMTVAFELDGQEFVALNGGPMFKFNESISFMVPCKTQAELDEHWDKLSEGGEVQMCGWLKDKFGLSWQIVPAALEEMMSDSDPARKDRVMKAVMGMKKLDIAELERAFGEPAGRA